MRHTWREAVNTNSNFKKLPRMLQKEVKRKKMKRRLRNREDRMRSSNRGLMGILEEEKTENEGESILTEIMVKMFQT